MKNKKIKKIKKIKNYDFNFDLLSIILKKVVFYSSVPVVKCTDYFVSIYCITFYDSSRQKRDIFFRVQKSHFVPK